MLDLSQFSSLIAGFDRGPYENGELMSIGFGPVVIACLIFWIGLKLQFAGKPAWIKWIAVIPLVVGVVLGIAPAQMFFSDQLYQALNGGGGKRALMHCAGIWAPVLGGIALVLWNKWVNKQKFEDL